MKISIPLRKKARIEMLPLIDIVFLLLVFFIYAMLSMAVHRGIQIQLPRSSEATPKSEEALSISINAEKQLFWNKEKIDSTELQQRLEENVAQKKETGKETSVLLFADKDLPYQSLFALIDLVNKAGISELSLQADAPTN